MGYHFFFIITGVYLGFEYFYFCFANLARFNRRISSSVLPENIDPQITSIHPFCFELSTEFSKNMAVCFLIFYIFIHFFDHTNLK